MSVGGGRGVRVSGRSNGIAWGVCLLSALHAAPASAQQLAPASAQQLAPVAPLVPSVSPLFSDDGLFGRSGALPPRAAFSPLQLSLMGGLFSQASALSGCFSREDASGNSLNGFALQRYSYLLLAPRLVLHGFSNAGCPIDAGLGSGLTYSVPLTKSLWLVPSAGFYAQPVLGYASSMVVTSAARVDVVKQLGWGRTLSLGLGTRQRTGSSQFSAVSFGGSF
jgi:hypothetical protein